MRRRDLVTFLGDATAWVTTARTQEPQHVLGFLSGLFHLPDALAAFHPDLKESGFIEGKNINVEFREAGGDYDLLRSFAAES
jgi:putative tryptophan/tyrosine transport system substrate-binding protein